MKDKRWMREVPLRGAGPDSARSTDTTRVVEHLGDAEALELLAQAPYGRVVFVRDGDPEIRPLSHLVDDGRVIVRTRLGAALSDTLSVDGGGLSLTFEADALDVERRTGWSVIVSGTAAPVTDPGRRDRYKELLRTMLAGTDDTVIAIQPKVVSGIRIVPADAGGGRR